MYRTISKNRIIFTFSAILMPFLSNGQDTLRSFLIPKTVTATHNAVLKYKQTSLDQKIIRGSISAFGYNVVIGVGLILSPEEVTKWSKEDKFSIESIMQQYERTFTSAPVFDKDLPIIDYAGHPYQGAIYYNALRSQGATVKQSAVFCIANSVLWEYIWEGGVEQPSIQDLVITPAAGIILGEVSHVLTLKMSRNGYKWYEKIFVCAFNPMYAINNGFKTRYTAHYSID